MVQQGESFTYEFRARPLACILSLSRDVAEKAHSQRAAWNADYRPAGRAQPANEMVMVMNAFDTNFDNENEVYAVNTKAFHYMKHPSRCAQAS